MGTWLGVQSGAAIGIILGAIFESCKQNKQEVNKVCAVNNLQLAQNQKRADTSPPATMGGSDQCKKVFTKQVLIRTCP